MFEITRIHDDALEYYINERIAYPNAEYDFTFEEQFLIYHIMQGDKAIYYAIDMKTNLTSEVCRRTDGIYDRETYKEMIPAILSAIKYTGDRRYIRGLAPDPMELIDSIFRSVLPEYGYAVRETQIELCKKSTRALRRRESLFVRPKLEPERASPISWLLFAQERRRKFISCRGSLSRSRPPT